MGFGHAELIYNALTGLSIENKELHIIPGTGHCPAIEAPERLSEILIAFFEKFNEERLHIITKRCLFVRGRYSL